MGHDGGYPGVEAFVSYHPATDHTLAVLCNYCGLTLPLMEACPEKSESNYGSVNAEQCTNSAGSY